MIARWVPFLWLAAAVALVAAALGVGRSPVLNELVLVQDLSGSVRDTDRSPLPDWLADLEAQANRLEWIAVAGTAALGRDRQVDAQGSHLSAGIDLAVALPRTGLTRRRIILLSDGRSTTGDPVLAARHASAVAMVDTVARGRSFARDGRFLSVQVPPRVQAGDEFVLQALVAGQGAGTLQVRANTRLEERSLKLVPAGRQVRVPLTLRQPGVHLLHLSLRARGDPVLQNNRARVAVLVRPHGKGLRIGRSGVAPGQVVPEQLRKVTWVELDDVTPRELSPEVQTALLSAVEDGTGLLVVAGPGWRNAGDMEDVFTCLPQHLRPRDPLFLSVAVDCSGSMESKIETAVAAVLQAWSHLGQGDTMSLVRFAATATVLQGPLRKDSMDREEARPLRLALKGLKPQGGTRLLEGLRKARLQVAGGRARYRHVLVVSDGETAEEEEEIAAGLAGLKPWLGQKGNGMTVVVVGGDPASDLLVRMKKAGIAVLEARDRLVELPELFVGTLRKLREVRQVSGRIAMKSHHPALQSLSLPETLPAYWRLGPLRKQATSLLETETGDVVASAGRHGMGRVVLLAGRPAADWRWPSAVRSALIDWISSEKGALSLDVDGEGQTMVRYSTEGPAGDLLEPVPLSVVPLEKGTAMHCDLRPSGSGVWEGPLPQLTPGLWRMDAPSISVPLYVPASREWETLGADGQQLTAIAEAGGGRFLSSASQIRPWLDVPVAGKENERKTVPLVLLISLGCMALALVAGALTGRRSSKSRQPKPAQ